MKKYLIVLTMLFIFIFPSVALCTVTGFNAGDYPDIENISVPDGYEHYLMTWHPDQIWESDVKGYWNIYFYNDESKIYVINIDGIDIAIIPRNTYICSSKAKIKFDNTLGSYYVENWKPNNMTPYKVASIDGKAVYINRDVCQLVHNSHDLYTQSGNFFMSANPFPEPPVIIAQLAGVSLDGLIGVTKVTTTQVLWAGLKILVIILGISLIIWLFRSLILYRR